MINYDLSIYVGDALDDVDVDGDEHVDVGGDEHVDVGGDESDELERCCG